MEKNDFVFNLTLIIAAMAFLFVLVNSMAGYVIMETASCDDDGCKMTCRTDTDCAGDICCLQGIVGVCKKMSECSSISQEIKVESRKLPKLESPAKFNQEGAEIYIALSVLVLLFIAAYYIRQNVSSRKAKARKKK